MPVGDEHHRQVISTLDASVLSSGILSLERIRVQSRQCNQRRDVRVRRELRSAALRARAERVRRAATTLSAVEEPLHGAHLDPPKSFWRSRINQGPASCRRLVFQPAARDTSPIRICILCDYWETLRRYVYVYYVIIRRQEHLACSAISLPLPLGAFFTNGEFFPMTTELVTRGVSRSWPPWPAVLFFYEASGGSAARSQIGIKACPTIRDRLRALQLQLQFIQLQLQLQLLGLWELFDHFQGFKQRRFPVVSVVSEHCVCLYARAPAVAEVSQGGRAAGRSRATCARL